MRGVEGSRVWQANKIRLVPIEARCVKYVYFVPPSLRPSSITLSSHIHGVKLCHATQDKNKSIWDHDMATLREFYFESLVRLSVVDPIDNDVDDHGRLREKYDGKLPREHYHDILEHFMNDVTNQDGTALDKVVDLSGVEVTERF